MQLGRIGLWTHVLDQRPMGQAAETIGAIEELGFRAVWVPEAVGRDPFVAATALLAATEQLTFATGIASIHARTAHAMQYAWKSVSEAFPGRFLLGLGVSHAPMVEGMHGHAYAKPYSTMVEYLDAMDRGVYFAAPPSVEPGRVLAALGPKMLRLSAERALGAHPYFVTPEHTAGARNILGDGPLLLPEQAVVFDSNPTTARQTARNHMGMYLALPNYANNLRRLGWSDEDITTASDRIVDAIVAWGTTEQIVARLRAHLDAGADHVSVQVLTQDQTGVPMNEWKELAAATASIS